jgi:hypothetical protein
MKGLRSPWVSGTLVVIAIGFVYYNFKPMIDRRARRSPAPAPAAASVPTAAPASTATQKVPQRPPVAATGPMSVNSTRSSSAAGIDRPYVIAHLAEWLESPRRDPFLFNTVQENAVAADPAAPSPVQQWKLKSVWRQSGDRRAVINEAIYREGDDIQGFLLERIDPDEVWIRGTNGVESLTFDYRKPPPSTNSVSTTPVGPNPANNLGPDRMQRVEKFLLGPQSDERRQLNVK